MLVKEPLPPMAMRDQVDFSRDDPWWIVGPPPPIHPFPPPRFYVPNPLYERPYHPPLCNNPRPAAPVRGEHHPLRNPRGREPGYHPYQRRSSYDQEQFRANFSYPRQ